MVAVVLGDESESETLNRPYSLTRTSHYRAGGAGCGGVQQQYPSFRRWTMRFAPFVVLAWVALGSAAEPDLRDTSRGLERQMRKLIDDAEPSIVAIVSSHRKYPGTPSKIPGQLGKYEPPARAVVGPWNPGSTVDSKLDLADAQNAADHTFGSGIVLDDGLILTAYHLIDGATKVYVRGPNGRGSYANIHAADARCDLAVLKPIDPIPGLKPATFGNVRLPAEAGDARATVFRGMSVVALGNPLAVGFTDGQPSASMGIIANVRRHAAGPNREDLRNSRSLHHYGTLLQTDARITIGGSGGGLFNLDGELIGMTSSVAAVAGVDTSGGFAIPFDRNYRRIVEVLKEGREVEYGFLGVAVGPTDGTRFDRGLRLSSVTPGTPAFMAGLGGSDLLVSIDGVPIREQDDLFLHIGSALAGSKVRLAVIRDGKPRDVEVVLAKAHHAMPSLATARATPAFGLHVDYSSVLFLKMQQAGDKRVSEVGLPNGVMVKSLDDKSPAAVKFREIGAGPDRWMVTGVDEEPVSTPREFTAAIAGKKAVRLTLVDPVDPSRPRTIDLP